MSGLRMDVVDPSIVCAFAQWLSTERVLTPQEHRIVRVLGEHFGSWLHARAIVRAAYPDGRHQPAELLAYDLAAFRTHVYRIRHKLEPTPWRIENRYHFGVYRLVAREEASRT